MNSKWRPVLAVVEKLRQKKKQLNFSALSVAQLLSGDAKSADFSAEATSAPPVALQVLKLFRVCVTLVNL